MTATTFPRLLADRVRGSGSHPLVTFYDDSTGERVELSFLTYANWVAKTSGLLQDELGVDRGGTVLLDLPTHWLGPVWLGAAWAAGLAVTTETDRAAAVDVVVCGPDGVHRYAALTTSGVAVVALSLRPMGSRFTTPLPGGVTDYGAVVWGQPDAFAPVEDPRPDDLAWLSSTTTATQRELLGAAADSAWSVSESRLVTDANPCSADGPRCLLGPLLSGGGTVWVARPDEDRWDARVVGERGTHTWRVSGQPRS